MQITRWLVPLSILLSAGAQTVLAHPGHGTTDPTTVAHTSEPIHLVPLLIAAVTFAVLGTLGIRQYRRAKSRQSK